MLLEDFAKFLGIVLDIVGQVIRFMDVGQQLGGLRIRQQTL